MVARSPVSCNARRTRSTYDGQRGPRSRLNGTSSSPPDTGPKGWSARTKSVIRGGVDERLVAIQAALRALPKDREQSESCLKPLVTKLPAGTKRVSLSKKRQIRVYRRDNFTCRYCGRETVLHAAVEYLAKQFPQTLPYHRNWKRSETHPLFNDITTSCEHIIPLSRGGDDDDRNLAAACARCQYMKSDWLLAELNWKLYEGRDSDWDGLTGLFLAASGSVRWTTPTLRTG